MQWFTCSKCGNEKDENLFYRDRTKKTGFRPDCKECNLAFVDKARRSRYEKEYWDQRRKERREMVLKSHNKNKDYHKKVRREYLKTDEGIAMHRRQTQKRYALKKSSFVSDVDPAELYKEQGGVCYICNRCFNFKEMECDHVIPLALGGKHHKVNCKMACVSCNRSKGAKLPEGLSYPVV